MCAEPKSQREERTDKREEQDTKRRQEAELRAQRERTKEIEARLQQQLHAARAQQLSQEAETTRLLMEKEMEVKILVKELEIKDQTATTHVSFATLQNLSALGMMNTNTTNAATRAQVPYTCNASMWALEVSKHKTCV